LRKIIRGIIIVSHSTYSKEERLKSRKVIELLFKEGKSYTAFPLKVLYAVVKDSSTPLQAGVSTSSRKFKKSVERNRVKRILREAYRLQKKPVQQALQEKKISLALFFIYVGKELPGFPEVYEKMGIILQKLQKEL
jgi:ribonuclease P protein component